MYIIYFERDSKGTLHAAVKLRAQNLLFLCRRAACFRHSMQIGRLCLGEFARLAACSSRNPIFDVWQIADTPRKNSTRGALLLTWRVNQLQTIDEKRHLLRWWVHTHDNPRPV